MPEAYTPSAPTGVGTDDYRCFLLDPKLPQDAFITGINVLPGNPDVVHHVILFRVPPDRGRRGRGARTRTSPGQGWTCFGDSGLAAAARDRRRALAGRVGARRQGAGATPRASAWSSAQGSQVDHAGALQPAGRRGARPSRGRSSGSPRATPDLTPLQTMLLPGAGRAALPPGHDDGPLCDRDAALADVKARFGDGPGSTADLLHFLCGAESTPGRSVVHAARSTARDHPRRGRPHAPARPVDQDRGQPRHADAPDDAEHPGVGLRQPGRPPIHAGPPDPGDTVRSPAGTASSCATSCRRSRASRTSTSSGARAPPTRCASGSCW